MEQKIAILTNIWLLWSNFIDDSKRREFYVSVNSSLSRTM